MSNPFTRKLQSVAPLSRSDAALIDSLFDREFIVAARTDLIREGDKPTHIHLLTNGFACRAKYQPEGDRQIVSFLIPGDLCDAHVRILGKMDHTISTIVHSKFVRISQAQMDRIMERPALAKAMWWSTLVEESVLREWVVNVGARPAKERHAHLFCELFVRLRAVGLTEGYAFRLPLTQQELGETTGLSSVHVNRALQALRSEGLVALEKRELEILDAVALVDLAGFDIDYLHFGSGYPSNSGTALHAGPTPHS